MGGRVYRFPQIQCSLCQITSTASRYLSLKKERNLDLQYKCSDRFKNTANICAENVTMAHIKYQPASHSGEHEDIQCIVNCAVPIAYCSAIGSGQVWLTVPQIICHKARDKAVVFKPNNDIDNGWECTQSKNCNNKINDSASATQTAQLSVKLLIRLCFVQRRKTRVAFSGGSDLKQCLHLKTILTRTISTWQHINAYDDRNYEKWWF